MSHSLTTWATQDGWHCHVICLAPASFVSCVPRSASDWGGFIIKCRFCASPAIFFSLQTYDRSGWLSLSASLSADSCCWEGAVRSPWRPRVPRREGCGDGYLNQGSRNGHSLGNFPTNGKRQKRKMYSRRPICQGMRRPPTTAPSSSMYLMASTPHDGRPKSLE